MVEAYRRPYLDACTFVSFIQGEPGRFDNMYDVLQRAIKGVFQIHSSTLTLAEVHRHRSVTNFNQRQSTKILEQFEAEYFVFIDVTRFIGEEAHKLMQIHTSLRPNDSIHLATAIYAKCDVLLTYDTGLLKCGCPGIRIEEPTMAPLKGMTLPSLF